MKTTKEIIRLMSVELEKIYGELDILDDFLKKKAIKYEKNMFTILLFALFYNKKIKRAELLETSASNVRRDRAHLSKGLQTIK